MQPAEVQGHYFAARIIAIRRHCHIDQILRRREQAIYGPAHAGAADHPPVGQTDFDMDPVRPDAMLPETAISQAFGCDQLYWRKPQLLETVESPKSADIV